MSRQRLAFGVIALSAALCLTGCADPKPAPAPPTRDLGADAARDAGNADGDVTVDGEVLADGEVPLEDGATPDDGAVPLDDGAVPLDAALPGDDGATPFDAGDSDAGDFDAGPIDAGVMEDASYADFGPPVACVDDAGAFDICACPARAVACSSPGDPACPAGTACLDTGCGATACLFAGAPCVDSTDCATGATCTGVSATERVCARPSGPCVDSRDCAGGYACEGTGAARACVNRRIPCSYLDACPYGFNCHAEAGVTGYCERAYTRCSNDGACPGRRCLDVDGDRLRECGYSGCTSSSSCAAGQQCAFEPMRITMLCGSHGVCHSAADCGSGEVCLDVWGDGVQQCEAAGSTCSAGSCPAGQLCGASVSGGVAQCRAVP